MMFIGSTRAHIMRFYVIVSVALRHIPWWRWRCRHWRRKQQLLIHSQQNSYFLLNSTTHQCAVGEFSAVAALSSALPLRRLLQPLLNGFLMLQWGFFTQRVYFSFKFPVKTFPSENVLKNRELTSPRKALSDSNPLKPAFLFRL